MDLPRNSLSCPRDICQPGLDLAGRWLKLLPPAGPPAGSRLALFGQKANFMYDSHAILLLGSCRSGEIRFAARELEVVSHVIEPRADMQLKSE